MAVVDRGNAFEYPKLLFTAEPGALVSPAYAESYAAKLKHCRLVHLGRGRHYLQEDHGATIGRHVAELIAQDQARSLISAR